jgi:Flp pilus assembly pilin Flp
MGCVALLLGPEASSLGLRWTFGWRRDCSKRDPGRSGPVEPAAVRSPLSLPGAVVHNPRVDRAGPERGATAVAYAVMVAIIALLLVGGVFVLSDSIKAALTGGAECVASPGACEDGSGGGGGGGPGGGGPGGGGGGGGTTTSTGSGSTTTTTSSATTTTGP